MAEGMKLRGPDGTELMEVSAIERDRDTLVMKCLVMRSIPMTAVLSPEQARRGLALMGFRNLLFAASLLLRRSAGKKRDRPGQGDA